MGSSFDRWSSGLSLLAVGCGIALCFPALRGQALALDEHVSYFSSGAPDLVEMWKRSEEVTALPPLSYLLERGSLAVGGHSETVLRIPSLLAYVLSIPAAWWLGRIAGGPRCGGLTATLVAWHPGVLDEVRIARCYGLILLLSTLSMAFLLRWRRDVAERRWLIAWSFAAVALLWTHYLTALLIGAEVLVLVVFLAGLPDSKRVAAGWWGLAAVSAISVCSLPLAYPVFRISEWGVVMESQWQLPTTLQAIGAPWTLSALAVVIIVTAWNALQPRQIFETVQQEDRRPIGAVIACWLIPLIALGALSLATNPMLATPRYRVMIAPASCLAVGLVAARTLSPAFSTLTAAALLVVSTLLTGVSPVVAGRLANPIEDEWKRAGLEFAARLDDASVLVFTQTGLAESSVLPVLPDNERLRKYVACRLGRFYTDSERAVPIPLLWDGRNPLLKTYRSFLLSPVIRSVWIVGATDTDLNAQSIEQIGGLIESSGFARIEGKDRPGLTIVRFERMSR